MSNSRTTVTSPLSEGSDNTGSSRMSRFKSVAKVEISVSKEYLRTGKLVISDQVS